VGCKAPKSGHPKILSLVPMKSWRFGIFRVSAILLGVRDATDASAAPLASPESPPEPDSQGVFLSK
jgi:hypothetical protein